MNKTTYGENKVKQPLRYLNTSDAYLVVLVMIVDRDDKRYTRVIYGDAIADATGFRRDIDLQHTPSTNHDGD